MHNPKFTIVCDPFWDSWPADRASVLALHYLHHHACCSHTHRHRYSYSHLPACLPWLLWGVLGSVLLKRLVRSLTKTVIDINGQIIHTNGSTGLLSWAAASSSCQLSPSSLPNWERKQFNPKLLLPVRAQREFSSGQRFGGWKWVPFATDNNPN